MVGCERRSKIYRLSANVASSVRNSGANNAFTRTDEGYFSTYVAGEIGPYRKREATLRRNEKNCSFGGNLLRFHCKREKLFRCWKSRNNEHIYVPSTYFFFLFIWPVQQKVSQKFSNLDAVVESTVHFIGISCGRLEDYELRRSRDCPAILMHGDDLVNSLALLPYLDNTSALDRDGAPLLLYKVLNPDSTDSNYIEF